MTDARSSTTAPDARRPDPAVVDDPAQLTPAWFDAALGDGAGASVRSVTTEPVGTGQMASTLRARLGLADGTTRTVVVKHARADVESAMAGMAYRKEVAFYDELAARLAVRTPECMYAAISDDAQRFVLLLEDMAGCAQGDQIAGCPVAHAEAAVVNLAGLHGPTWNDAALADQPWLGGGADVAGIDPEVMVPIIGMAVDQFAERFSEELEPYERAVLDASRELLPAWMFERGERTAVLHGDYRLDNLLFPQGDPAGVAAVDWQTASLGPPARDLAYFLETCLDVDDRRAHERDLVETYRTALGDHGVDDYGAEDCWDDYVDGMLHGPLIILLGRLTAGITERGDEMFRVMWRRSATAIDDHGTLDVVRR
jgi:aminoglycoside/choline kinase family phosphotransferase